MWRWGASCTSAQVYAPHHSELSLQPRQQLQKTFVNLHHNSRFTSQILYRFQKTQIPHFWSLEICGVDLTTLTRLAPSSHLLHNQPQIPSQLQALIAYMTYTPRIITYGRPISVPCHQARPPQNDQEMRRARFSGAAA
jgi:hypothetical protein